MTESEAEAVTLRYLRDREELRLHHEPEVHRLSHSSLPREPFYRAQAAMNRALADFERRRDSDPGWIRARLVLRRRALLHDLLLVEAELAKP